MRRSWKIQTALWIGVLLVGWHGWAFSGRKNVSDLATELARMRSEVEQLSSQIEEKRQEQRSQLRSLSMRKGSLELSLQQAQIQFRQVQQQYQEQQKKSAASGVAEEKLKPVVIQSIQAIRVAIEQGLPFRLQERLAALQTLEQQLKGQLIRPLQAANRLWQIVDDELRLGRENGLYTQVIPLQNKRVLMEVVRLGMVMLFFKTRTGQYGSAVRKGNVWSYELLHSPEEIKQVHELFESFKQKIRSGFFVLPNRFPPL